MNISNLSKEALFDRLSEITRSREVELRRCIARICEGDTIEAMRAVVERVTEAMMDAVAQELSAEEHERLIEKLFDAKYATFEAVTGQPFTTEAARSFWMRKEIRDAATTQPTPEASPR